MHPAVPHLPIANAILTYSIALDPFLCSIQASIEGSK
jgi:hypothetical protein